MTHTLTPLANPHMACTLCHWPVPAWHNPDNCCGVGVWSEPCTHPDDVYSRCPTWLPETGCTCRQTFGRIEHPPAPAVPR